MNFSDFAMILHSIQGGHKYEFVRELLCAGLDDDGREIIQELPDDESGKNRMRKYFTGKRGITEIAVQIINYFHEDHFIEYMTDMEDQYDQICEKFEQAGVHIDNGSVPNRLAEIFREILERAATGQKQMQSASSVTSEASYSASASLIQPAQNTKSALKQLLVEIGLKWNKLTAPTVSLLLPSLAQERNEYLEKMFELACQHYSLNLNLKDYFDHYPRFKTLNALFQMGFKLDEEMKNLWVEGKPLSDYPHLKSYWDLLNKCLQEIDSLPD